MNGFKVLLYDWMGGNEAIFRAINSIRGEQYDKIMQLISWATDKERFPLIFALYFGCFFLTVLWKLIRRREGVKTYISFCSGVMVILVVGFVVNAAAIHTLKSVFAMPRPYAILTDQPEPYVKYKQWSSNAPLPKQPVYQLEKQEPEEAYRSFPSGHVAFATLMLVAFWPLLNNFAAFVGACFVLLVGWSRISLGVHFPADVMGSIIITTPLIMLLRYYINTIFRKLFGINF